MTKKSMPKLKKMLGMGPKVTIDGKTYMQEDLTPACMTALQALQEANHRFHKAQQDVLLAQAAIMALNAEVRTLLPGATPRGDTPEGQKAD